MPFRNDANWSLKYQKLEMKSHRFHAIAWWLSDLVSAIIGDPAEISELQLNGCDLWCTAVRAPPRGMGVAGP